MPAAQPVSASPARPNPPPRRARRRFGWKTTLVALLIVGAAGYAAIQRPWEPKPVSVAVETLTRGPLTRVLAVNGRIAAKRSVAVRSGVSGQVIEVLAEEGDVVTAGQVIARLDASQPKAQVAQARAALDAGIVRLAQAQSNADRARALGDNSPRKTLEDAELSLTAAQNEVERLRGALDQVESLLRQYDIAAPLNGSVLARTVETGQMLDTQTALFTIADLSELIVTTDVDELYSAEINTGLAAILSPAGVSETLRGRVSFAAPVVDATTGGRAIEISFDDPVSLPVGLTVMVNIIVEEQPAALSIPRSALTGDTVFVVTEGKATARDVRYLDWPAERVLVLAGLAEGDQVIVNPVGVSEGKAVKVKGE
jgi:membrane fusion protein, multidrug efflux system